jgi:hypothetical protein
MEDMDKTRLEGPVCDYYRFQGLTEKLSKTHKIVLAKRVKDRIRSINWLGWDLCVKSGIFTGGYL